MRHRRSGRSPRPVEIPAEPPWGRRVRRVGHPLAMPAIFLGVAAATGAARAAPAEGSKPQARPRTYVLPPKGYARTLASAITDQKEVEGLRIKVAVIPDAYRYYMALGLEDLERAADSEGRVRADLVRRLHAKHRAKKGKVLFRVYLSATDSKCHYFLQARLRSHVTLRTRTRKTIGVSDIKPTPRFLTWQIFEQRNDVRRVYRRRLAEFRSLGFSVLWRPTSGDRKPVILSMRSLFRCREGRGLEGVNMQMRQLAFADRRAQIVPPIAFTFYPERFETPPASAAFEAILEDLEKRR